MRLLPASREILRVLSICPWIPVDVLAAFVGARSRVSVYQALARLAAAGLARKRQAWVGPSAGARPIALWSATARGQAALLTLGSSSTKALGERTLRSLIGCQAGCTRTQLSDPLRVGAARALAAWLAAQRASGQLMEIADWQAPFIRRLPSGAGRRFRMPAAALVEFAERTGARAQQVIVVPDVGTAPIVRHQSTLRRLFESLAHAEAESPTYPTRLLLVTTNVEGRGARQVAWTLLLKQLRTEAGVRQLAIDILDWPKVYRLLGRRVADPSAGAVDRVDRPLTVHGRRADEMLHLLGRHPCLTIEQLADLLAVSPRRAGVLRHELVGQGLLRLITKSELGGYARPSRAPDRSVVADLAELTAAGRRQLARGLGLSMAAARRHHGLFGGSSKHRHRALRNLAHTIGVNDVFVRLALAARAATAHGAHEALEEWQPAAACERSRCKPDGYGCYRRGDACYGFLLEYDRGTERASQYTAKLAAYYRYRNRGQAARDYNGFPTIFFVTTSSAAEARIVAAAERVWRYFGGAPLPILTATTARMLADPLGLRGGIWARPRFQHDD